MDQPHWEIMALYTNQCVRQREDDGQTKEILTQKSFRIPTIIVGCQNPLGTCPLVLQIQCHKFNVRLPQGQ